MNAKTYRECLQNLEFPTRSQAKQRAAVESREAIVTERERKRLHKCPHCQSARLGRWDMKIIGILMSLLMALSMNPALADDALAMAANNPQTIIENVSNKIQARMQDQKFTQDFKQVTDYVSSVIEPYTDFDLISVLVLGKYWKSATPSEKERFKKEFKTLLIRVYARGFVEFKNWTIKFFPIHPQEGEQKVFVKTQVLQSASQPVAVDYRMLFIQGNWKVYDILIDGTSLVMTYRNSFKNDMESAGGSLEKIINDLTERNKKAYSGTES